ncbi:MAG: Na+/H+ antiporter NhaA [Chitinophagaceae bacterium]|nr:Na+/H+ antiporter NhaA [Chitinophagaceae bacterium]
MRITRLFSEFFNSEKSSGAVLIACTIISLILANSFNAQDYIHFWEYSFSGHSIEHWVNDGLMSIFFLLIGLELVREIYVGELSDFKSALSPILAAGGGMLVPAGLYFVMNMGLPSIGGAGIPMATDIAFALGVLSLLGKRVPTSLKIFLTALAVIDDLGAILTIAIFYTKSIDFGNLAISLSIFAVLLTFNKLKVRSLIPYIIGGVAMWYFMLHSGVHATISGVLLAFTIPFGNGDERSASYRLQHFLHWPVAFIILPIFALANTAIPFPSTWAAGLLEPNAIGIFLGLVIGKPLGVVLVTFLFVKMGLTKLPEALRWRHILGAGILAGIGFTMSIFITLLAFDTHEFIISSKIAILFSSLIAAVVGLLFLRFSSPNFVVQEEDNL